MAEPTEVKPTLWTFAMNEAARIVDLHANTMTAENVTCYPSVLSGIANDLRWRATNLSDAALEQFAVATPPSPVAPEIEIAEARAIIAKCCNALPNGAHCSPDASIEFMRHVPDEIAAITTRMAGEIERLTEWKSAIIDLCRAIGSEAMPWGGDKTGWGFIHYFVQHLHTRAETAEASLAEALKERDAVREKCGGCITPAEHAAEIERLRAALCTAAAAMKIASVLPGVSDEYDFEPAISAVRAALGRG